MTPYHINISSGINFLFVAAIDYENIFTMKVSRFMVLEKYYRYQWCCDWPILQPSILTLLNISSNNSSPSNEDFFN